ncbi:Hypothetical protein GLP15_192 [Giardia lamblia P15]|uniref:C2H2-type domain-containing protein n=1 Tax=Giardia intestinalis (strain P15) TaxID=658858 RepID=E1F1G3_GIAIA|nr:Hypothetical protein GLP15_192 [Giardia lamblia P15]
MRLAQLTMWFASILAPHSTHLELRTRSAETVGPGSQNSDRMSSDSNGRRSPDEGTEAQSITDSSPMNAPMNEPLRKTCKTIKKKTTKGPGDAADKARKREQGSSRILLPPTNLPVSEDGCVVAEPTAPIPLGTHPAPTGSIADYMNWLKEARVHLRNYTFGDLPTYLSYAIHSTKSCHGYFCVSCHASFGTPRGLEQHIWGNLTHLGLTLLMPLYTKRDSQPGAFCCPFCDFATDRQSQLTLHQALTPDCRRPTWALTMARRNAPDRSNIGLEHFPDSPEVLRYDPEYVFGQTKPALLNNQQYQGALELLAAWWSQVNPNPQQGQHEPAPLVTLDPLPPEQARDAQSLTPPQRALEPAELYERGIAPDTYQHIVNASSLTGDMLRYHSENEGLVCTRERLVRTIEKLHLSYESVEAFMDMLTGTKVGGIPAWTCLRCYRSDLDLRRHLLETEHSTLEWHQVNLSVSRNGKKMCPFCSKAFRSERAVQTHCNTDTGCRALLRERMGLKEKETNILFSTHRANMLRGGYTTPLIEPQSREARARQEIAEMSLAYTAGKRKNALAPPRQPTCPACSLRFASRAELAAHLSNATDDQHLAVQRGRIRMTGGWFKARDLAPRGTRAPPPADGEHGPPRQDHRRGGGQGNQVHGALEVPGPSGLGCAGESSSRCRASRRPLRRPSTRSSARPRGGDTGPCTSSAWSSSPRTRQGASTGRSRSVRRS